MRISFSRALLFAIAGHIVFAGVFVFIMSPRDEKIMDFFFWGSILRTGELLPVRDLQLLPYQRNDPDILIGQKGQDRLPEWVGNLSFGKQIRSGLVSREKSNPIKFSGPRIAMDDVSSSGDLGVDGVIYSPRLRMQYGQP